MKALLWIIAIVALAAGLVALAYYSAGYVLIVSPPYRVELSLNLFLAILLAGFVALHVLVRIIAGTLRIPARVRELRAARRRQKAYATLLEALQEFFAGRYARAEKAAAAAIELGEQVALAAVVAARAAHGLRAFDRRDGYLARAASAAPADSAVRAVTEAELLLDERRYGEALNSLSALSRKHTAALRLELKGHQLARNWDQVLALVDELEKRGVFDPEQAERIRSHAQAENLKRRGQDREALLEAWRKVPPRQKKDTRVAAAAAQCFMQLGEHAAARQIIEQSLEENWDSGLVALYGEGADGTALPRIERAESWLKAHPRDAVLLLTLGRLCAREKLWGKAQSYLEASLAIEPTYSANLELARLHESLGNAEAAGMHYRTSLELAVAQLKEVTGGRRRTPL